MRERQVWRDIYALFYSLLSCGVIDWEVREIHFEGVNDCQNPSRAIEKKAVI